MSRGPSRRQVIRGVAALAGSCLLGLTALLATASPALALTGPTGAPTPGLVANCPPGTPPAGKGVNSPTGSAAGFTLNSPGGNCTPTTAAARIASATNGAVTFGPIEASCVVSPVIVTSQVVVSSGLTGAGIADGSVIRDFRTVTFGGHTYIFNQSTPNGVIALQIDGVPLSQVSCPGSAYPLNVAPAQAAPAGLGGLQTSTSSGGTHVSSLLVLVLAGAALLIVNVVGIRAFRHRDHS